MDRLLHILDRVAAFRCDLVCRNQEIAVLVQVPDHAFRGVSHCFTGEARQALGFVARGFCVSFSGVVTFKSAQQVQEAARAVPLERVLVETDCPYMAPMPHRGKRCEPAHVLDTARFLARLRGEDERRVLEATVANTRRIFALA